MIAEKGVRPGPPEWIVNLIVNRRRKRQARSHTALALGAVVLVKVVEVAAAVGVWVVDDDTRTCD